MKRADSMVVRLTGLVFLLLFLTIATLLVLVNNQMDAHFTQYLQMNQMMHGGMGHMGGMGEMEEMPGMPGMMGGAAERHYVSAVHQSLLWVGLLMIAVSVIVSFFFVRRVLRPLSDLTQAVRVVQQGHYGETLPVRRYDEIGTLTATFNEMSAQLARNEGERRRLFASIAHELRTPLAILQGNLEGMVDDVVPLNKEHILSLEDEVLRLGRLVQDLRDLSLAETEALALQPVKSNLNTLLRRAVSMMEPLCDEKHLQVTLTLAPDLPVALLDEDRINQVIYNILNNAIRYVPPGSAIHLSTDVTQEEGKRYIRAQIADNGPGIPKEDLAHIFQYFYRGEKSRNRKSGGSGIGLALARQFILAHGGQITATSSHRHGTTFTFKLPCP